MVTCNRITPVASQWLGPGGLSAVCRLFDGFFGLFDPFAVVCARAWLLLCCSWVFYPPAPPSPPSPPPPALALESLYCTVRGGCPHLWLRCPQPHHRRAKTAWTTQSPIGSGVYQFSSSAKSRLSNDETPLTTAKMGIARITAPSQMRTSVKSLLYITYGALQINELGCRDILLASKVSIRMIPPS